MNRATDHPPTPEPENGVRTRKWHPLVTALFIGGCALGFAWLAFSGTNWIEWVRSIPHGWRFLFWPAMVVLPLLGFPISIFYLGAALLFPMWTALLLGPICLSLNMAFGYWLGHSLWRDFTMRQIQRRFPGYSGLSAKNAFRTVVLIRAVPGVPYFLQNYILAVIHVRFWLYIWCSAVIQCGFLIGILFTVNGSLNREPFLALSGGLLVVLVLLIIRRTLEKESKIPDL